LAQLWPQVYHGLINYSPTYNYYPEIATREHSPSISYYSLLFPYTYHRSNKLPVECSLVNKAEQLDQTCALAISNDWEIWKSPWQSHEVRADGPTLLSKEKPGDPFMSFIYGEIWNLSAIFQIVSGLESEGGDRRGREYLEAGHRWAVARACWWSRGGRWPGGWCERWRRPVQWTRCNLVCRCSELGVI